MAGKNSEKARENAQDTTEKNQPETKGNERFFKGVFTFVVYGIVWAIIFAGFSAVKNGVQTYFDQKRQIEELIQRLKRYEDPDFSDGDEKEEDETIPDWKDEGKTPLASWVKANLPSKGIDEMEDVAAVFTDLADKLDAGDLLGERDAFSEGIAQLQPVATRSVWLPFFTKLTKKLKKEHLDAAGLSSSFRVIAAAIYPAKKKGKSPSDILIESIWRGELPSNTPPVKDDKLVEKEVISPENANVAPEKAVPENTPTPDVETAKEKCPDGKCPTGNNKSGYGYGYGYGYGNGGYFWPY